MTSSLLASDVIHGRPLKSFPDEVRDKESNFNFPVAKIYLQSRSFITCFLLTRIFQWGPPISPTGPISPISPKSLKSSTSPTRPTRPTSPKSSTSPTRPTRPTRLTSSTSSTGPTSLISPTSPTSPSTRRLIVWFLRSGRVRLGYKWIPHKLALLTEYFQ